MENNLELRKLILNQPEYWMEKINAEIYDELIRYKKSNNLKKQDLAKQLDISPSRLSQILSDEDYNYNLETLFKIIIKLGKFPVMNFENQDSYILKEEKEHQQKYAEHEFSLADLMAFKPIKFPRGRRKVIQMNSNQSNVYQPELKQA